MPCCLWRSNRNKKKCRKSKRLNLSPWIHISRLSIWTKLRKAWANLRSWKIHWTPSKTMRRRGKWARGFRWWLLKRSLRCKWRMIRLHLFAHPWTCLLNCRTNFRKLPKINKSSSVDTRSSGLGMEPIQVAVNFSSIEWRVTCASLSKRSNSFRPRSIPSATSWLISSRHFSIFKRIESKRTKARSRLFGSGIFLTVISPKKTFSTSFQKTGNTASTCKLGRECLFCVLKQLRIGTCGWAASDILLRAPWRSRTSWKRTMTESTKRWRFAPNTCKR